MITVAPIVEGDGEVAALPVLLRRLDEQNPLSDTVRISTPIRVYKDRFLNKPEEFRRHLLLAAAKAGTRGWVLIVLDADDDCPAEKGADILQRAQALVPHRPVSVVLANREYEAWFIAAAESLSGHRNFYLSLQEAPNNPEVPRNAKGWLAKQMGGAGYNETTDQPAFSQRMDLDMVYERSRSFRKLCSEWRKQGQLLDASPAA